LTSKKIIDLNKFPFHILYIEDERITRENTSLLLEEFATNITTAINGEDALEKFQNNNINLIITDLNMPKLNGMSFIQKIRLIDKKIPIVILSASNDKETLHASIEQGVQGYLVKPINMLKLTTLISTIKKEHQSFFNTKKNLNKFNTNSFLEYGQNKLIDYLDTLPSSMLILIKIEEFKYLNSSLTSKISKKLQKRFAKKLFSHMPKKCNFSKIFLLERGEFVFAKKYSSSLADKSFHQEVREFQESINNAKIKIGLVDYTLTIMTSLAYGEDALENAKAGLRNLLHSRKNFIIANELLEKEKEFAMKKLQTFKMLRKAINTYNIVSFFQPIVKNETKKVVKYESLVRLIDEDNNIVSPYHFLDTAKEGKYYHEITSIVLRNSFRALFYTDMEISVNLSTLDIEEEQTQKEFFSLLERYRAEAHRITVELVEDESVNEINITKKFIETIKEHGVKIAIDDFGKGFSNFSRVLTYNPDYIKIDGTLVKDIEKNDISRNLVETIVFFCKKQGIETIAEYVENENIFNILCSLGVDYSQGYHFGKPERLKEISL